jgi:hypothetical protein
MEPTDSLPRDVQSILELTSRSMFDLFANASEGMMLVDRQARVVWVNDQLMLRNRPEQLKLCVGRTRGIDE